MCARVILKVLYDASYGSPINVNIKGGHKNTDLQARLIKIFALVDFFNNHDSTVAWSNYRFFQCNWDAVRLSEKLENYQEYR